MTESYLVKYKYKNNIGYWESDAKVFKHYVSKSEHSTVRRDFKRYMDDLGIKHYKIISIIYQ